MSASPPQPLPPRKKPELDVISERKQGLVKDFYDKVWLPQSQEEDWPQSWKVLSEENQRIWCYKLMVARKFDIENAKEMLKTIRDFRKEWKTEGVPHFPPAIRTCGYNMEELIAFFPEQKNQPRTQNQEVDKIFKHMQITYNPVIHKWDKWGHPVLIESYGVTEPTLLVAKAKQLAAIGETLTDVVNRYHVHQNEMAVRLTRFQNEVWAKKQQPEKDPKTGEEVSVKVHGILVVVDITGLSMAHLTSDVISAIGTMFGLDKAVYPEFISKVLVVNCNTLLRMAYGLVKPFLDVRVQEKISFYGPGEATEKALREWIHEEDIPKHLGGKCECPGGCVHKPTKAEQLKAIRELGKEAKDAELAEIGVPIDAGAKMNREYKIKNAKDEVVYEWQSDNGYTVEFSAHFYAEADEKERKNGKELVKPEKVTSHKGVSVCDEPGTVVLTFSNEFSWMRSKYVTLRGFVVNKDSTEVAVEGTEGPVAETTTTITNSDDTTDKKSDE